MEIDTVPARTSEIFNVRVVPVPDKVPLVAEPVPEIVMFDAVNAPGSALKVKLISVVVGVPKGVALHVISGAGVTSTTVLAARSALPEVIETDTVPAITSETVNVRVVPVPDKVPLIAEPISEVIVMSDAVNVPGLALKVKLSVVVVGLPAAVTVQLFATSVTV